MNTEEKLIELIANKAGVDSDYIINKSQSLRNDLDLNSLDIIELTMDIEKELNVVIPDEKIEVITDVQSVIDIVRDISSK